ncbi:amino acid ABC transporter substrate-binding protein [Spartinivicinus ruber]|uniref:amino acid ABC transporter substrate-binding protein n=1 Tax=Spartinivicinus ruber TaxID=2683272 RepID=UPI0013D48FA7|nr:amino acid ABC transporter substrate-binding protein [Spartinivicinus ruber]
MLFKYTAVNGLGIVIIRKRIDGDHERNNLKILLRGRVDFTLLPTSTINYLVKELSLHDQVYLAPKKHTTFHRMFLIPKNRKDIEEFLTRIAFSNNYKWNEIIKKYGFAKN